MTTNKFGKFIATAMLATLALLAACGDGNKLTEGTVVDRWVEPEHTTYVNGGCMVWSGSGASRFCTLYQQIPITHPSEYYIQIEGTHEGETLVEAHRINRDDWNRLQDGETWVDG